MTERQRALWGKIRRRGWLRYVLVRGIFRYGLPLGALMLLCRYFLSFTRGQWYGWRSELLFLIPYWIILGIIIAYVQWRIAERSYALPPLSAQDRATALEREVARTRGFALLCLAGLLILAGVLLRGCATS
jgi:hypothetical protein